MVALCWSEKPNRVGVPGAIIADSERTTGKGSHGSLGQFDVHNTLIAAGPDFRHGMTDDLPSGNIDVAPTILRILGWEPQEKLDGRVLTEALTADQLEPPLPHEQQTMEARRTFGDHVWRQRLYMSRVGSTTYFDKGDGEFSRAETR